jgi:uncharacterized membrane protein YadS
MMISLTLSAAAYYLGLQIPVIGGPVFGITFGILTASFWKLPSSSQKGIKFTSKYILQLAVVLLGFEMNAANVLRVGQQSVFIILLTLIAAFLTAFLVDKLLQINKKRECLKAG